MIVDGRKIAEEIRGKLKAQIEKRKINARLAIVYLGHDPVIEKFISVKKKFAEAIGVQIKIYNILDFPSYADGIIVQLPLPAGYDIDKVLARIPPEKDVDALGLKPLVDAPVAAAVREILEKYNVDARNKKILVIGQGRLVGKPVAEMFQRAGADVRVADINTKDISSMTLDSEIIVSGVGVPALVKSEMIKEGVILIDAGTSEGPSTGFGAAPSTESGTNLRFVGDIDPACAAKASLFTPTPGGLGPITVAMIFKNLLKLIEA